MSDVGDMVKGLSSSEERRRGKKKGESVVLRLMAALDLRSLQCHSCHLLDPGGTGGTGSAEGGKQASSQQCLCEAKSDILLSVIESATINGDR